VLVFFASTSAYKVISMNKENLLKYHSTALFYTIIIMSKFNCVAYWLTAFIVFLVEVGILSKTDMSDMRTKDILSLGMDLFFASIYLICCGFFFMGIVLFISSIYFICMSDKGIHNTQITY